MNIDLKISLPDTVTISSEELKLYLAYILFDKGILTPGQAADMAETSKRSFIENAGKYGFSIFQYDHNEIEQDVKNWLNDYGN